MTTINQKLVRTAGSYNKFYLLYFESGSYYMVELVLDENNLPSFNTFSNQWDAYPNFITDDPDKPYISGTVRTNWLRYDVTPIIDTFFPIAQSNELFASTNPLEAYLRLFTISLNQAPPAPTNDFQISPELVEILLNL
jgi:hypothetical protein